MSIIDKVFLNWYTQALGGVVGILVCVLAYLEGNMIVYGNITNNIDSVWIGGIFASYTLIPLCILVTIIGVIESYKSNMTLTTINKSLILITIIVGFLGAKLYFIIPSILILFKFYSTYILSNKKLEKNLEQSVEEVKQIQKPKRIKESEENKIRKVQYTTKVENVVLEKEEQLSFNVDTDTSSCDYEKNIIKTRKSMAKDLLAQNADKQFICDITGLDLDEIESIEKDNN